jgi:hypothetical protein
MFLSYMNFLSIIFIGIIYMYKPYNYNGTEKTCIYNNKYKMDINVYTIYTTETGL